MGTMKDALPTLQVETPPALPLLGSPCVPPGRRPQPKSTVPPGGVQRAGEAAPTAPPAGAQGEGRGRQPQLSPQRHLLDCRWRAIPQP